KVFPVVILGGLDSVIGAVIGGLIVGVGGNFAAGYLHPYVRGGTKDLPPYLLRIGALMNRPYRPFGKAAVGAAWCPRSTASPASSRRPTRPTWRFIRCPSPNGRWRRSRCCSSSSRRSRSANI